MKRLKTGAMQIALALALCIPVVATAADEIPRAASTPNTPKNWVGPGPGVKILAQALVDETFAKHPELVSITVHTTPPGQKDIYTMIAGTFPDRIGNESSPGDVITIKKGVSQVESKWGTPDYGKKVSIVLPVKDSAGKYLPAAIILAFKQSADSGKIDTDFLQPGLAIRDGLASRIADVPALFSAVK